MVLDFLGSHQEDFELEYQANFTDNFKRQTKNIAKAKLRAKGTESFDETILEVRIEAGTIPQEEIEHALATGKNHLRDGKKYIC